MSFKVTDASNHGKLFNLSWRNMLNKIHNKKEV